MPYKNHYPCAIEGCPKKRAQQGYCAMHYSRLKRNGSPDAVQHKRYDNISDWDKFWSRAVVKDGCWDWDGARGNYGYAIIHPRGTYGHAKAHRWLWEALYGPLPSCLELDHLCRNPICTNPDHLEPVTHSENVRRGMFPIIAGTWQKQRTHCPRNHPYDETNTYLYQGRRYCRECKRRPRGTRKVAQNTTPY